MIMHMCRLAGVDQTLLNDVVSFLDPFLEASLAFEGDKSPTLHHSVPWLYKLNKHCVPLADDSATIRAIKQRAKDLLEEKFSLQTIHYVAAALNPKMKHLKMMDAEPTHKEAVYTSMRQMIALFDNGNDTFGVEMTANGSYNSHSYFVMSLNLNYTRCKIFLTDISQIFLTADPGALLTPKE
jgi:hypothetical protein